MISFFFEKLLNLLSTEVPPELAACEFDCRKEECLTQDFLTCPRRLQKAEALKRLSEGAEPTNISKSHSSTLE